MVVCLYLDSGSILSIYSMHLCLDLVIIKAILFHLTTDLANWTIPPPWEGGLGKFANFVVVVVQTSGVAAAQKHLNGFRCIHQLTLACLMLLEAMIGHKLRPNGQNSWFCFAQLSILIIWYHCPGVCWRMFRCIHWGDRQSTRLNGR